MPGKNIAVFGIYSAGKDAQSAVDALIGAGFPSGDISVLLPDTRRAAGSSLIRRIPRLLRAPPRA